MGIEPTIFRFEVGRLIHWATRPCATICLYLSYKYHNSRTLEIRVYFVMVGHSHVGSFATHTMFCDICSDFEKKNEVVNS